MKGDYTGWCAGGGALQLLCAGVGDGGGGTLQLDALEVHCSQTDCGVVCWRGGTGG